LISQQGKFDVGPVFFDCFDENSDQTDIRECYPDVSFGHRVCSNIQLFRFYPWLCGMTVTHRQTFSPISSQRSGLESSVEHFYMPQNMCGAISEWAVLRRQSVHERVHELLFRTGGRDQGHGGILHSFGMYVANRLHRVYPHAVASEAIHMLQIMKRSFFHVGTMHGFLWQILGSAWDLGMPRHVWAAQACRSLLVPDDNPWLFLFQQCAHGAGHGFFLLGFKTELCSDTEIVLLFDEEETTASLFFWVNFCQRGMLMQNELATDWITT